MSFKHSCLHSCANIWLKPEIYVYPGLMVWSELDPNWTGKFVGFFIRFAGFNWFTETILNQPCGHHIDSSANTNKTRPIPILLWLSHPRCASLPWGRASAQRLRLQRSDGCFGPLNWAWGVGQSYGYLDVIFWRCTAQHFNIVAPCLWYGRTMLVAMVDVQ